MPRPLHPREDTRYPLYRRLGGPQSWSGGVRKISTAPGFDPRTVHRVASQNYFIASLWIKPTDALNSSFIGITTLHVPGSLSAHHQEFLSVHRLWYILCNCDNRLLPGVGWNCSSTLLLVANGHHNCMHQSRCTAKNSWWWAERLPGTRRVITPIKLEFSASVGFIHKESVTMHGHVCMYTSGSKRFSTLSDT